MSSFLKPTSRRAGVAGVWSAAALLLSVLAAGPVAGQEADGEFEGETEYVAKDGTRREIKEPSSKDRRKVIDLFNQGKSSNKDEEQAFEDLAHYYVYALTWKKNISTLADRRKDLKNKWLVPSGQRNRTVTDLHKRLNELTLTTCRQVAEDPKYPRAIRYGCVLMIAELDAQEIQPGVSAPVPLPEATTALMEIVADAKQHLAMRICAIIGLKRHTQFGIAAPLQPQIADVMLGIIEKPVGEGKDRIGQTWLRLVAADLLQAMIAKEIAVDQPKAAASLIALIGDDTLPNWARAKFAGDLGHLDGKSVQGAAVPSAVRALAGLMLAVSQASPFLPDESAEEEDAEQEKDEGDKKKDDKKKDDKKKDGEKDEEKKKEKEEVSPAVQKASSEEMLWQLSQIRMALFGKEAATSRETGPDSFSGLDVTADDATKATIVKIVKHIDDIVKSLANPKTLGDPKALQKLGDVLATANQDLEAVLSSPVAEEAQAAKAPPPGTARPRPQGNAPAGESKVSE
ncbi:MAG TPA: hypothetical protein VNH11_23895 [Pirellulales bacterium]|nr:hypothetical protein [Pirellulales bacterium]